MNIKHLLLIPALVAIVNAEISNESTNFSPSETRAIRRVAIIMQLMQCYPHSDNEEHLREIILKDFFNTLTHLPLKHRLYFEEMFKLVSETGNAIDAANNAEVRLRIAEESKEKLKMIKEKYSQELKKPMGYYQQSEELSSLLNHRIINLKKKKSHSENEINNLKLEILLDLINVKLIAEKYVPVRSHL